MIGIIKNLFNDERIVFLSDKELKINNGNIFNWKRWINWGFNNWRVKGSFKRDWGKRKSFGVDFKIIIKRILIIGIMKNLFNEITMKEFLSDKELEIFVIENFDNWNEEEKETRKRRE